MIETNALFKVTYGLYLVCSGDKIKGNGYVCNTVMQVSAEPVLFTICCNKNNYTAELIQQHGAFSVSVLEQDCSADLIGVFGYKSGRDSDKMKGKDIRWGDTGVPIVLNESIAFLECKVTQTIDAGTHLMFIGETVQAEVLDNSKDPLTYAYYQQVRKGVSPKNAPTYIKPEVLEETSSAQDLKIYRCPVCGYDFEDTENQTFKDLPDDWTCPVCNAPKDAFEKVS